MEGILDALAKLKLNFGAETEAEDSTKGGFNQSLIVVSGLNRICTHTHTHTHEGLLVNSWPRT